MRQPDKRCFILFLLFPLAVHAQRIATLDVAIPAAHKGIMIPMKQALDPITTLPDSAIQLFEISSAGRKEVPFQVTYEGARMLHWLIPAQGAAVRKTFELVKGKQPKFPTALKIEKANGALTIRDGNRNLLQYHFGTVYPPAGIDTVYRRSGFIHPLWSPRGQELTRINAPDHYHHWGMWNPWTETFFEGDSVDFWNLARRQGTVRFARFVSLTKGPAFAEYKTLHEHVVYKKQNPEKVAINELQTMRIYQPAAQQNYYIADMTVELNCATDSPIVLLEYRYGGLGIRATEAWNKENSQVLTSEGKTRKDADGSMARWCMVQGAVQNDHAGLVMLSYPTNYNHPEPLRVWPENTNGRGDVFLNFSPTKNRSWKLEPGRTYVLQYRFLVFNDPFSKEQAEAAWQGFANMPEVKVVKNEAVDKSKVKSKN